MLVIQGSGVAKIDDNAKVAKSKILPEANGTDTLAAHFASLSSSINEVKTEYDGQSRRLIVTTPKIFSRQHLYPILFCYRLAEETNVFAAFSPMSCGMVKGAHDPGQKIKFVPILQVIGDQDKSFNGSQNKVTMYSARKPIAVWRKFNQCDPNPVVLKKGKEIMVYTCANQAGIEVALC